MPIVKVSDTREGATCGQTVVSIHGHLGQLYPRVTIDMIPDEILLEIFNVYVDEAHDDDAWHNLVHVCRRWRCIVFASPRRLHIALLCTDKRQVKKMLDIWPSLPIVIAADMRGYAPGWDVNNVIAALEQHSRVAGIRISGISNSLLGKLVEMKNLFPILTDLALTSGICGYAQVLPDSFLGESTPRLRLLSLEGIPFPGLCKLLSSTTNLVHLSLSNIRHSGYISLEAMATSMSALSRLESLTVNFLSSSPWAERERRHTLPVARVVLPALTNCNLTGVSKYVENFVSQIDAPLLDNIAIALFEFDRSLSDTPLLRDFIGRTKAFKAPSRADVVFSYRRFQVALFQRKGMIDHKVLALSIDQPGWHALSLARLYMSTFQPLPALEHLELHESQYFQPVWEDMEDAQWHKLLHPYISVRDLLLSGNLVQMVVLAIRELTREGTTEVLPALQNIFLQQFPSSLLGPVQEAIGQFVAARQLSGHPVVIHYPDRRK